MALYKTIPKIYEDTFNQVNIDYPPGTRESQLPYLRWAKMEKLLFELGNNFSEIKVKKIYNNAKNRAFYMLETISFKFSISKNNVDNSKPRAAEFRKDFNDMNQIEMDFGENEVDETNSKVYMTLIHGSKESFSEKPEFIYFYLDKIGTISLIDLIQSSVDDSFEIQEEQFIEKLPKLKNTGSD